MSLTWHPGSFTRTYNLAPNSVLLLAMFLLRVPLPFDSRLSPFDSRLSPFDSRLSPFDSRLSPFDSRLSRFDSRLSRFDSRLSRFDSRLSPFDSRLSPFDSRLAFRFAAFAASREWRPREIPRCDGGGARQRHEGDCVPPVGAQGAADDAGAAGRDQRGHCDQLVAAGLDERPEAQVVQGDVRGVPGHHRAAGEVLGPRHRAHLHPVPPSRIVPTTASH